MPKQDKLLVQLDRYWECPMCGRIIDDPDTAKTSEKAGMGWGLDIPCPKCSSAVAPKGKFPVTRFRPLFEMMVECFQIKRAILIVILAQTAFEAMVGNFVGGLLARKDCPEDVENAILNTVDHVSTQQKFIKYATGKSISELFRDVGFGDIMGRFEEIKGIRNSFLHTGAMTRELTVDDMKKALKFAYDMVDAFAALYSEHPELRPVDRTQERYDEY